jgi:hypothetical protein
MPDKEDPKWDKWREQRDKIRIEALKWIKEAFESYFKNETEEQKAERTTGMYLNLWKGEATRAEQITAAEMLMEANSVMSSLPRELLDAFRSGVTPIVLRGSLGETGIVPEHGCPDPDCPACSERRATKKRKEILH